MRLTPSEERLTPSEMHQKDIERVKRENAELFDKLALRYFPGSREKSLIEMMAEIWLAGYDAKAEEED